VYGSLFFCTGNSSRNNEADREAHSVLQDTDEQERNYPLHNAVACCQPYCALTMLTVRCTRRLPYGQLRRAHHAVIIWSSALPFSAALFLLESVLPSKQSSVLQGCAFFKTFHKGHIISVLVRTFCVLRKGIPCMGSVIF
jgi:hypothetical protein